MFYVNPGARVYEINSSAKTGYLLVLAPRFIFLKVSQLSLSPYPAY